jgi:preprotein translocase subunit YajC
LPGYIFILLLLVLMWLLLIRPQRQRQLQQQRMISAVEVGKEIVTAGGLYGTVTAVQDDEVHVEIAPDVQVRIAKRAIAGVISTDEEEEDEELEAAEEPGGDTPANLSR